MNWVRSLEKKFGKYHIKSLMKYIVILNAITLIAVNILPTLYQQLVFVPSLILQGQVWRLLSFLLIPPGFNLLFTAIALYFYYIIGEALERTWGAFKFNLYYLIGVLVLIAAAFATGSSVTPMLLNLSLFLAFAKEYPNEEFLLFFVVPVKARYLSYLNWFYIGFMLIAGGLDAKTMAVAAISNYLIFYWRETLNDFKRGKIRSDRKKTLQHQVISADFTYHRCHVCGRTEKSNPELTFRYCNQCVGDYEFCNEHIFDHAHVEAPLS